MSSIALRVKKHRDHLRSLGFRPIQIWVPDTRRKGFMEECKRQSKLIRNDREEIDTLDFIASVSDHEGWI